MGLGDAIRRLLGGGGTAEPPPDRATAVEYKGYRIIAAPKRQGGQFLTAGIIEKDFPDGTRSQEFIRADTHGGEEDARSFAVTKAKQIIDSEGDRLFR